MLYAVVDIETTGNGPKGQKITEISALIFDGKKIVNEFTSLVNPEQNIPAFITSLTGITNAMVRNAPKFFEIAKKVAEITKDTIFVAHNVNFDYNIIHAYKTGCDFIFTFDNIKKKANGKPLTKELVLQIIAS